MKLSGLSIGCVQFSDILTFYLNCSTSNKFLLLSTITYNNKLIEVSVVFLKYNVNYILATKTNLLCKITDVAYGQHRPT